ncbi:MAG: xanthine dehydrogenase family protein molybdopterin-binding subunit [Saprospiraceae bacterium]|nr:xanthine dehydrogenase family protein molybdopterin-binding subunit [Saprospiraceae bacterium]
MGCLTVGISLPDITRPSFKDRLIQDQLPGSLRNHPGLDAWLEILADNRIRVFSGKIELGQGIGVVIQQVAAEELNADLNQVEVILADTGLTPNEGYTAGSGSVKNSAIAVRYAAATARERLCQLAGERLGLPPDQLHLHQGMVVSKDDTFSMPISEVLEGKKWEMEVTLPVKIWPYKLYRFSGKSIPRPDLDKIVRGQPFFIQDLKFPGMLHARVLRPPSYSSYILKFDLEAYKRSIAEGIELVNDGSFLALVGKDEYQVELAIKDLSEMVTWIQAETLPDETSLKDQLVEQAGAAQEVVREGTLYPTHSESGTFKGSFYKPYIMHGSIGPACGIARFQDEMLQVWTHSQGVFPFRSALSSMLNLQEENIHVVGVPGAGCFGHNSADDAAADAAVIAKAMPGKYIRVQWSRSQEHQWEALGSAMRMDIEAGLDSEGQISFWKASIYSDSHSTRPNKDAGTLIPARYLQRSKLLEGRGYLGGGYRNAQPYYKISNLDIKAHFFDGPLRVSSLRSLGAYANIFAIESIVDEMSMKQEIHPLDFRINLLNDQRAIDVILKLRQMTNNITPVSGEGLGFAFSRYKNNDAYCAVAAQVKVLGSGQVHLLKMWAALDAGEVMNPDGLANQTEGGMIQAASWTLLEEVRFDAEHITSKDWTSYPILRYRDIPDVEVAILARPEEAPLGGGEAAQPPTPAAITNAIFRATGKRIYDLPVGKV